MENYLLGILLFFAVLFANIGVRLWLNDRKAAIARFHFFCLETLHKADFFPWPSIHQLTNEEYFVKQAQEYEKIKPDHDCMLYSFKELTIENWFTIEKQKHLFGLPHQPKENKEKLEPIKNN